MSKYISVLNQMVQKNYPDAHCQDKIIITNIQFQIFYPKTSIVLQKYKKLKTLVINNCDLRNLQNFPLLQNLQELDLAYNQLQGTLNHLMKCKKITYINLANNIISEVTKLAPLKRIGNVTICIKDNPLCLTDGYNYKLKCYNIKTTKQPKKIVGIKNQQKSSQDKLRQFRRKSKQQEQIMFPGALQRSISHQYDFSNILLGRRSITQHSDHRHSLSFQDRTDRLPSSRSQFDRRLQRLQIADPQRVRRIRQRLNERDLLQRQIINRDNRGNPLGRPNGRYNLMNARMSISNRASLQLQQATNMFFRPNLQIGIDSYGSSSQLNYQNQDNEHEEEDDDDNQDNQIQDQEDEQQDVDVDVDVDLLQNVQNSQSQIQLNNFISINQNNNLRQIRQRQSIFLIDNLNGSNISDSSSDHSQIQNNDNIDEDEQQQQQ